MAAGGAAVGGRLSPPGDGRVLRPTPPATGRPEGAARRPPQLQTLASTGGTGGGITPAAHSGPYAWGHSAGGDRRSPRLVAHLRAARVLATSWPVREDSGTRRPQTGTGFPPVCSDSDETATLVARLARFSERGDPAPASLLLDCIARVRELEFSAAGGDALLWMVQPVLRALQWRLEEAAEERQALEVEVSALHARAEQVSMDVEAERDWLLRADERARQRLRDRRAATENLKLDAIRMEKELAEVQAACDELRQEADEGLSTERENAARERQRLEEQVADLDGKIRELTQKLDLEEAFKAANDQFENGKAKLAKFQPVCMKQEELARRVDDREAQNQTILEEIAAIEEEIQRKAARKKGGKKKK